MKYVFCSFDRLSKSLKEGTFNKIPTYCEESCKSEKCKEHYNRLLKVDEGYYTCPNGFMTVVSNELIFTCLRIVGISDDTTRKRIANEKVIAYRKEEIKNYIECIKDETIEYQKLLRESEFLGALLHDFRKYNSMKLDISEYLSKKVTYNPRRTIKYKDIKEHVYAYYSLSNITKARLDTFEELHSDNKESIFDNVPVQLNIFKTFDKLRHCGQLISNKGTKILVEATDTIPDLMLKREVDSAFYLIIDNAIKYTELGHPINIRISSNSNYVFVTVLSIGPLNKPEELEYIFERGFRGENAKAIEEDGQGIGLYTVKKICDRNGIEISAKSTGPIQKIRDVEYCMFEVNLKIHNNTIECSR